MEITVQKPVQKSIDGDVVVEAIENYIEYSKFPRGLVVKKLSLKMKEIERATIEIEKICDKSQLELNKMMTSTNDLNIKCNSLLYNLRDELLK